MMVRNLSPDKRNQFFQAALKLFVAQGVQHTSTAEIAKAAGTASGTLFLYFPTKQDLINALVLKISQEQSEYIHARLGSFLSARETFHVIWTGSVHWLLDNREAYLYVRQVRDSGMVTAEVVEQTAQYLDYYYIAIQKGLEEGSIKRYALDLIGGFLYQDILAVLNFLDLKQDEVDAEMTIEQGFEIFWNGIRQDKELK